jgi:hypothetical protein
VSKLLETSAILALVLAGAVTACGGSPAAHSQTSSAACADASAPRHAYVVVEHLSGTTVQKCVGFSTYAIDGKTLMDRSGLEYQAQTFSFGSAVCQVDSEPKQFSQCFPQGQPYWALFVESGGQWTTAPSGYTDVVVHDKEAIGWHYVQAADPSPAPPPPAKE